VIVGGGDFAREVLWTASCVPEHARDWEVGGILDDDVDAANERLRAAGERAAVLGTIAGHSPSPDERFICAIGDPRAKLAVCEDLVKRGARFTSVIDPSAAIAPSATLGTGVFIFRNALVSVGARVGDFVTVNCYSSVGHDVEVGDGATLSSHCDVTGRARLGRGAFLGVMRSCCRAGAWATSPSSARGAWSCAASKTARR
jgi:acetyltransferase-like isoleucine patch superfamily enzyme